MSAFMTVEEVWETARRLWGEEAWVQAILDPSTNKWVYKVGTKIVFTRTLPRKWWQVRAKEIEVESVQVWGMGTGWERAFEEVEKKNAGVLTLADRYRVWPTVQDPVDKLISAVSP